MTQPPSYMPPTQAPLPPQPPRRVRAAHFLWPLAGVAAAAAVVAVLYVTGVIPHGGSQTPTPAAPATQQVATFTMTGTYLVLGDAHNHVTNGQSCQGNGPDGKPIGPSTTVRVFDRQGHQLATGGLSGGTAIVNSLQTACQFTVTVDGVPDGLPSYGVEVGTYGVRQVSSLDAHQGFSIIN